MAALTDKEMRVIAYTLLGEAAGEGREGMEAVMWTIRNRAESGRYSDNPAAVATQKNKKGVYQYSTWNKKHDGGNSPESRFSSESPAFKEALAVVQRVMAGEVKDPTGGATHFYAEGSTKPGWFDAEGPAGEVKIGRHRFAARNTATDAAATASDAAQLLANGRLVPRPQSPVAAYAPEPGETPESGLTTRTVQSVEINPSTGMPYPRLSAESSSSSLSREVVRLQEIRSRQSQDLVGAPARVSPVNAAASEKTSRNRDQVGAPARVSSTNAASAAKTDRARPAVQPAVTGQNKTVEQIGREADNARMSGYRDIQEMSASSQGAKPTTQTVQPKSGTTKTGGTVTDQGTRLPLAGDTQMPRTVKPQVVVPERPKPVTTFIKPVTKSPAQTVRENSPFALPGQTGARTPSGVPVLTVDDGKRLKEGKLPLDPTEKAKAIPQGPMGRGRGGRGKPSTSIQIEEPTVEQVVAVRKPLARGASVVQRKVAQQQREQSVAATIAREIRVAAPAYSSVQYLSNGVPNPAYRNYNTVHQSEGGGLMPVNAYGGNGGGGFTDSLGGIYYDRHLSGSESSSSKSGSSWSWW